MYSTYEESINQYTAARTFRSDRGIVVIGIGIVWGSDSDARAERDAEGAISESTSALSRMQGPQTHVSPRRVPRSVPAAWPRPRQAGHWVVSYGGVG